MLNLIEDTIFPAISHPKFVVLKQTWRVVPLMLRKQSNQAFSTLQPSFELDDNSLWNIKLFAMQQAEIIFRKSGYE